MEWIAVPFHVLLQGFLSHHFSDRGGQPAVFSFAAVATAAVVSAAAVGGAAAVGVAAPLEDTPSFACEL